VQPDKDLNDVYLHVIRALPDQLRPPFPYRVLRRPQGLRHATSLRYQQTTFTPHASLFGLVNHMSNAVHSHLCFSACTGPTQCTCAPAPAYHLVQIVCSPSCQTHTLRIHTQRRSAGSSETASLYFHTRIIARTSPAGHPHKATRHQIMRKI
jgi:hypothetical protein